MRHHRKSKALLIGNYAIEKTGIRRFDWHDAYYNAVTLSWPRFLLSFAALFLAINFVFGFLYLIRPGSLANAHPGSWSDALFFSLQTATTVGYGDIYPANLYSRIVAGAEMMVGFSFTALTTGLLFVRFSRPKARIRYAKNAVIATHNGSPTLMIRIANARFGFIANASAHLGLIRTSRSTDGEPLRQVHELPLLRPRLPLFSLIWTLMHRIDTTSPLHGYDAATH